MTMDDDELQDPVEEMFAQIKPGTAAEEAHYWEVLEATIAKRRAADSQERASRNWTSRNKRR